MSSVPVSMVRGGVIAAFAAVLFAANGIAFGFIWKTGPTVEPAPVP